MRFAISMRKTSLKMITLGHVENPRKSKSNYLKPVARAQREVRPMYGVSSAEISLNYLHLKVNVHLTVKRKKKDWQADNALRNAPSSFRFQDCIIWQLNVTCIGMFQDLKPRFSFGLPLASFVFSIHPSSFAFLLLLFPRLFLKIVT